jgi:hypothetical protein
LQSCNAWRGFWAQRQVSKIFEATVYTKRACSLLVNTSLLQLQFLDHFILCLFLSSVQRYCKRYTLIPIRCKLSTRVYVKQPLIQINTYTEGLSLLDYYAASSDNFLPTFLDNLLAIGCPETSVKAQFSSISRRKSQITHCTSTVWLKIICPSASFNTTI